MDVKMPRDEAGARSEEMRQPDEVAEMQQSIEQRGGECRVIGECAGPSRADTSALF